MEHVVFFPGPDGSPSSRRAGSLEEAVRLVEHLRNVDGVSDVAVHPLGEEVQLSFRTWYRVEVPAAAPVPPVDVAPVPPLDVAPPAEPLRAVPALDAAEPTAAPAAPAAEPVAEVPAQPATEEPVGAGARSLGFFAT